MPSSKLCTIAISDFSGASCEKTLGIWYYNLTHIICNHGCCNKGLIWTTCILLTPHSFMTRRFLFSWTILTKRNNTMCTFSTHAQAFIGFICTDDVELLLTPKSVTTLSLNGGLSQSVFGSSYFYLVWKRLHRGLSFRHCSPPPIVGTLPSNLHSLPLSRGATKVRPHFGEEFPLSYKIRWRI